MAGDPPPFPGQGEAGLASGDVAGLVGPPEAPLAARVLFSQHLLLQLPLLPRAQVAILFLQVPDWRPAVALKMGLILCKGKEKN